MKTFKMLKLALESSHVDEIKEHSSETDEWLSMKLLTWWEFQLGQIRELVQKDSLNKHQAGTKFLPHTWFYCLCTNF
jgi:hypothetical protein